MLRSRSSACSQRPSHEVSINFLFDLTVFSGDTPTVRLNGTVWGQYPCNTGDSIGAHVWVTLELEAIDMPPIEGKVVSHCGDRPLSLPVLEVDLRITEPVKIGELLELAELYASLDIYRNADGSEWFFMSLAGRTKPGSGALNFDAQINVTNEHDGAVEVVADVTGSYAADGMLIEFRGFVAVTVECVEFEVSGHLQLTGGLPLNATILGKMKCPRAAEDDPSAKITNFTFVAMVEEMQLTPELSIEDLGVSIELAMRSGGAGGAGDGDAKFEINITGTVRFDNTAAGGGGGASVDAHVTIFTSLGKYDWCGECPVVLGKFMLEAGINITTPEFAMLGAVKFSYPCEKGDVSGGMANLDVNAGDLQIKNFTVVVRYFCDSGDSLTMPAWTLVGAGEYSHRDPPKFQGTGDVVKE